MTRFCQIWCKSVKKRLRNVGGRKKANRQKNIILPKFCKIAFLQKRKYNKQKRYLSSFFHLFVLLFASGAREYSHLDEPGGDHQGREGEHDKGQFPAVHEADDESEPD